MISLEETREILDPKNRLTDRQIIRVRDNLYAIVNRLLDEYLCEQREHCEPDNVETMK